MPWKLIGFIVLLVFFVTFSGLNVQKIQVNLGIVTISDVPLFVTLMVSFILGTLVTVPFMVISGKNRSSKGLKRQNNKKADVPESKKKKDEKDKTVADKLKDDN